MPVFDRERLRVFVDSPVFHRAVIAVIALNGIALGLETSHGLADRHATAFLVIDRVILGVFVIEIILRIVVHGKAFFRDPWSWFDLIIVGMALVPASESVSILRLFRFLRVLRLISVVPGMRRVVSALFTMFTVLTVENWPQVAGDVMAKEPLAWIFFATFIVITAFFVLNLLIGVIVSAMEAEVNAQRWKEDQELELKQHTAVMDEIRALSERADRLAAALPVAVSTRPAGADARDAAPADRTPGGEAPQPE
ncbi:ion transporter [Microbispora rosea]|uniref:ion transporter n=1 Tax=Microbispora rosea TaxID=58117 RepID=UPI003D8A49D9